MEFGFKSWLTSGFPRRAYQPQKVSLSLTSPPSLSPPSPPLPLLPPSPHTQTPTHPPTTTTHPTPTQTPHTRTSLLLPLTSPSSPPPSSLTHTHHPLTHTPTEAPSSLSPSSPLSSSIDKSSLWRTRVVFPTRLMGPLEPSPQCIPSPWNGVIAWLLKFCSLQLPGCEDPRSPNKFVSAPVYPNRDDLPSPTTFMSPSLTSSSGNKGKSSGATAYRPWWTHRDVKWNNASGTFLARTMRLETLRYTWSDMKESLRTQDRDTRTVQPQPLRTNTKSVHGKQASTLDQSRTKLACTGTKLHGKTSFNCNQYTVRAHVFCHIHFVSVLVPACCHNCPSTYSHIVEHAYNRTEILSFFHNAFVFIFVITMATKQRHVVNVELRLVGILILEWTVFFPNRSRWVFFFRLPEV